MRKVLLEIEVPINFPGTNEEYQELMEEILERYGSEEYWTVSCAYCGDGDHFTSQCTEAYPQSDASNDALRRYEDDLEKHRLGDNAVRRRSPRDGH